MRFSVQLLCLLLGHLYGDTCSESRRKRDVWENIRIAVYYDNLAESKQQHPQFTRLMTEVIIPTLVSYWERSMSVIPVRGPLKMERYCTGVNDDCDSFEAAHCPTSSGFDVGIPSSLLDEHVVYYRDSFGKLNPSVSPGGEGTHADFVLLVSLRDDETCNGYSVDDSEEYSIDLPTTSSIVAGEAYICRRDACGRPILSVIHLCPRITNINSTHSIGLLYHTVGHEMTHGFGFSSDSFHLLRHFSGVPRITQKKQIKYTSVVDDNGNPIVEWDVSLDETNDLVHTYTFLPGIVSSPQLGSSLSRGGVGSSRFGCSRCPLDPSKTYSSSDIEHCFKNRHNCAFVVTTPTVVSVVRDYFDCGSLFGAELENHAVLIPNSPCPSLIDSHWKQRLFGDEYMSPLSTGGLQFISAVTFAFLDDTGWYKMNYSLASGIGDNSGIFWGYKMGCPFVGSKCLGGVGNTRVARRRRNRNKRANKATSMVHGTDTRFFCNKRLRYPVCSSHALYKVRCDLDGPNYNIENASPLYRYAISGSMAKMDYCPSYVPATVSQSSYCTLDAPTDESLLLEGEIYSPSSRCLDQLIQGTRNEGINRRRKRFAKRPENAVFRAMCVQIECFEKGTSYSVTTEWGTETCTAEGQLIEFTHEQDEQDEQDEQSVKPVVLVCSSPHVICTEYQLHHVLPQHSPIGTVAGELRRSDGNDAIQKLADQIRMEQNRRFPNKSSGIRFGVGCILVLVAIVAATV